MRISPCPICQVVLAQGNHAQATALFQQCIAANQEVPWLTLSCLEGLGAVAAAQGDGQRAARLWGAAEARHAAIAMPRDAQYTPDYERWVAAARNRFDAAPFAAAWAAGRGRRVSGRNG